MQLLFPVSALIVMYSKMFLSLQDHARRTRRFQNSFPDNDIQRATKNVLLNLFIVTIIFLSLVTPCEIITFMFIISEFNSDWAVKFGSADGLLINIAFYMISLNSALNPLVYSFRYKQFRKGIAATFFAVQKT